jgi:hypothetical protein
MYHHQENIKPPPYLHYYRGFDKYAEDILANRRLFLKSAIDFNDPFDCSAFSFKRVLGIACRNSFRKELRKPYISDSQKSRIQAILDDKLYNDPSIWDSIVIGFQSQVVKLGIFCFTERPDNFLMWSHYADKHNGLCFGFEAALLPIDLKRLMKIRYRKSRPKLWFHDQKDYHFVINVKSSIWKYEKEWRAVVPNAANSFVPFQENALHAVLCGVGMKDDKVQIISKYLSSYRNSPKLYKANRHSTKYGIQFHPIQYR